VALAERDHSGVAIDECADCGGIWLDKGELESIEERDGEGWMSRWVRSLLEGRG
jgi:Zn-finger nucleic acid-binding protein